MSGSLWVPSTDVAGDQATIAANKRWQSRLFTSSGTWTVPADVGVIWVDGCGGGAGGGGGDPTPGGGGSGGGCGFAIRFFPLPVASGDMLTLAVGAGGIGGNPGADGSNGFNSSISKNGNKLILLAASSGGRKGTPSAGGAARGALPYAIDGTNTIPNISYLPNFAPPEIVCANFIGYYAPTSGGALNASGGIRYNASISGSGFAPASTGGTSGGGGGHGGGGPFFESGNSGLGGVNGSSGGHATGYGCGGGGGSGNAAGGNGSPGMIRIYCLSSFPI